MAKQKTGIRTCSQDRGAEEMDGAQKAPPNPPHARPSNRRARSRRQEDGPKAAPRLHQRRAKQRIAIQPSPREDFSGLRCAPREVRDLASPPPRMAWRRRM